MVSKMVRSTAHRAPTSCSDHSFSLPTFAEEFKSPIEEMELACGVHYSKLPLIYKEERFHEFHKPSKEETKKDLKDSITDLVVKNRNEAIKANWKAFGGEAQFSVPSCCYFPCLVANWPLLF